jgi:hypothetical protein
LRDQRAILEEFFNVLAERGVRIATTEQGRELANAVADTYFAIRGDSPDAGRRGASGSAGATRFWANLGIRLSGMPQARS